MPSGPALRRGDVVDGAGLDRGARFFVWGELDVGLELRSYELLDERGRPAVRVVPWHEVPLLAIAEPNVAGAPGTGRTGHPVRLALEVASA